ncbi:uncharacterized protein LOC143222802 isoform X2 [Tachypleus tridentatus]|uniref:uncharacterized protein LOC143222802 isoform X2 n=1 Tax=Tachypleus tridentatus TaxID=6853 RepID=UPI003FD07775
MGSPCKADNWILLGKGGASYHLPQSMIFIGRQECDILLQSSSVDKRHAVICYDASERYFCIKDLNSLNGTYLNGLRIPEQSYVKLNHLDCLRFGYGSDVFYVRKSVEASAPKQTIESSSCLSQDDQSSKGATLLSRPFTDSWNSTSQNRETSTKFKRHSVGDTDVNGCHVVANRKYSTSDKLQDPQEKLQYTDSLEDLRTTPNSAQEQSSHSRLSPVFLVSQKLQPQAKPSVMSPHGSHTNAKSATQTDDSSHPHSPEGTAVEKTPTSATQHTVSEESFSNKAESPCSEDKNDRTDSGIVSSPDKGVATSPVAFTIAFSNEFAAPRKTLGIKDSISKFAPPDRQRQRTKANDNTNGTKALSQDLKSASPIEANRKQERLTSEKSEEYSEEKVKVKHKESPSRKQPAANGKLSTSATYLIQRMLDSEPSTKIVSEQETSQEISPCSLERKKQFTPPQKHSSPKQDSKRQQKHLHSPTVDKELYIGDDKSETGTYTVEGDQTDKDLEEARRKIDEVFGVLINHDSVSETQNACTLVGGITKIPDAVSEEMKKPAEFSHQEHSKEQTPSRPKRRLPTPPVQNLVQSVNTTRSSSPSRITPKPISSPHPKRKGQSCLQQSWHGELPSGLCVQESSTGELMDSRLTTSTNDLQLKPLPPDRSIKKGKKISTKRTVSPGRSNDIMTKSVDGALQNPADKRSPRAKTGGILWKKMPWNLTSSEQDLDHSRSETASIVSDLSTSTEPSSQSSGRGKTDSGPQMKLNRAFALRRARLGLDSDTPCGVSGANSRPPTGTTDVKNRATHLNPSLNRQDGGRFSLRLPRSSPRPGSAKFADAKKPAVGRVSSPKSQQKAKKKQPSDYKGHKRNDSDPGKPRILHRKTSFTVTVSDTEARSGTPNSQNSSFDGDSNQFFHRSASFSGADDLLTEHRPFRGIPISLSHRDFTGKSHLRSQSFRNNQLAKTKQGTYNKKEEFIDNGLKAEIDQEKSQSGQQKRELSALDCLVVSAIYQLSAKLRSTARIILEKEKHPTNSDTRLMIDEVLPQITDKRLPDYTLDINHTNLTRELSSVLKNLKRVEQGIEVVATLMDSQCEDESPKQKEQNASHSGFFIVDV